MEYIIRAVRGHYEVYSLEGRFLCSGDTEAEAIATMEE